jgi:dUTP pyrophosphatase
MKVYKDISFAEVPQFATEGSAAFDLKACIGSETKLKCYNPHNKEFLLPSKLNSHGVWNVQIQPQFRTLVPTGLIFDIPTNHVLKIFIRSSMALKYGITLANNVGIIDSDYVDPLYIMLYNISDTPIQIFNGDRIAQGILEKTLNYKLTETTDKPTQKTSRTGGLGSTGT